MKKRLDQLLDNDCLTPEQERSIRRLVKYELFMEEDDQLYISYYCKHRPEATHLYYFNDRFHVNGINKDIVYKHIMYCLIISGNDKSRTLKKEINQLFFKEDIKFNTFQPLKSKSQDLYELWQRVGKARRVLVG